MVNHCLALCARPEHLSQYLLYLASVFFPQKIWESVGEICREGSEMNKRLLWKRGLYTKLLFINYFVIREAIYILI